MRVLFQLRIAALRIVMISVLALAACSPPPAPPTAPPVLTLYNWAEYMPQSVLDEFEGETGIHVDYRTYDSQDEAATSIQSGMAYDVAVIAYDWVPTLRREGLLAKLDYQNLPNFKNIGPQFRNLFYDPDNSYTVPYLWGTTGLLVRTDLVKQPVTRWADLWEQEFAGNILVRPVASELFGAALLAHGAMLNSEDPAELAAALSHLEALKPRLEFVPVETEDALRPLLLGEATVMIGWNGDALTARAENPAITYVLPEEGAIAWVDNFVISARSSHKAEAEAFINFVLRPEISARISEAYYYPSANDAANQHVDDSLRTDPLVFPPAEDVAQLTFYTPHSTEVEQLYEKLWHEFQAVK
jgi:spermidine/putrescine transport system substrate-binding protein